MLGLHFFQKVRRCGEPNDSGMSTWATQGEEHHLLNYQVKSTVAINFSF